MAELRDTAVDVVVLQRPRELELTREWLGRRPGVDVPAVYVEHNAPPERPVTTRHPLAHRTDIPVVHVTDFNNLMWDNGICPTLVIPHGIVDPTYRYTGELDRAATMINEPIRRNRITGTDLLPQLARAAPIDVFGIGTLGAELGENVCGKGDLAPPAVYAEIARRRVYVHSARWTSLGLSLLEAMHLGMPIVAVGATETVAAVPEQAGVVSTDPGRLEAAVAGFVADREYATAVGKSARATALARFGIEAFLRRWDRVLESVARREYR